MEEITETSAEKHVLIPVECIQPDRDQPRVFFDKDKLYRLSLSLKKRGQKQPIIVKQIEGPVDYQIVDGERRWRACQLAQIEEIKAVVIKVKDESGINNFLTALPTPKFQSIFFIKLQGSRANAKIRSLVIIDGPCNHFKNKQKNEYHKQEQKNIQDQ